MNDKSLNAQTVRFPHVLERTDAEKAWTGHTFVIVDDEAGSWREYSLERERQEIEEDLQWQLRRQANRPSPEAAWVYYRNMDLWPVTLAVIWVQCGGDPMLAMVTWDEWENSRPPAEYYAAADNLRNGISVGDVMAKGIPATAPSRHGAPDENRYVAIDKTAWVDLRWDVEVKYSGAHPVGNMAPSFHKVCVIKATLLAKWPARSASASTPEPVDREATASAASDLARKGGRRSGEVRKQKAEVGWHAHALELALPIMGRMSNLSLDDLADKVLASWRQKGITPQRSTLSQHLGKLRRAGQIPRRK